MLKRLMVSLLWLIGSACGDAGGAMTDDAVGGSAAGGNATGGTAVVAAGGNSAGGTVAEGGAGTGGMVATGGTASGGTAGVSTGGTASGGTSTGGTAGMVATGGTAGAGTGGMPVVCVATTERCDGKDNDCDGFTDESFHPDGIESNPEQRCSDVLKPWQTCAGTQWAVVRQPGSATAAARMSWGAAQKQCASLGLVLPTISNNLENECYLSAGVSVIWLGLTGGSTGGKWVWASGSTSTYRGAGLGSAGTNLCAAWMDQAWQAQDCTNPYWVVCATR